MAEPVTEIATSCPKNGHSCYGPLITERR